MAAWPCESSGVLNYARCWCWPQSVCPWVPATSSAWAVGAAEPRERGKAKTMTVGGRGVSLSAAAAGCAGFFPCHLPVCCQASCPSEGPRSLGRTHLGRLLPPLGCPVLTVAGGEDVGGACPLSPTPPTTAQLARWSKGMNQRLREVQAGWPREMGQSWPATGEREGAWTCVPILQEMGKRSCHAREQEGKNETKRKLRSSPGSLLAAAREGPAARVSRAPMLVLPALPRPRHSCFAFASRQWVPAAPPLPCCHHCVHDAASVGQSGEGAGAVRVGLGPVPAGRSCLWATTTDGTRAVCCRWWLPG